MGNCKRHGHLGEILIVDDLAENHEALSAMLVRDKYKVRLAQSGQQALDAINKRLPDLILLNIRMPKMDGYEVCRRLKAQEHTSHIPVIFITALEDAQNKAKGFRLGAVDYITKPFESLEVLARVKTHLSNRKTQAQLEQTNKELQKALNELKDANRHLRESQEFNQSLLNSSPDIIYIYDLIESQNIYSNEGVTNVLGYSVEKIQDLGKNVITSLMHPEDLNTYDKEILPRYQRLKDGELIEHEYRMKNKDGMWCWLHSKESIFQRLPNGEPKQIFGVINDITYRKQVEETLRLSEERYKLAIEGTRDGLWDWNLQTNEAVCSDQFYLMLGYQPGELPSTGAAWYDLLHPEDKEAAFEKVEEYIQQKTDRYESTFRMRSKDGHYRWIRGRGKCQYDEEGSAVRFVGFNTDITERIQAEEILRKNRMQADILASILNNTPLALVYYKIEETRIELLDWNQSSERVFGWKKEEVIGKNFFEFLPAESDIPMVQDIYQALKKDRSPHNLVNRCNTRFGRVVLISWFNNSFYEDNTGAIYVVSLGMDITEQKELEMSLKESEERFRTVADFTYDWEMWRDENESLLYISPSCKRITGYDSNEFMEDSKLIEKIVHPDDDERMKSHYETCYNPKSGVENIQFRILSRDGHVRWIGHTCQSVFDEKGNWRGRRISNKDITVQKELENKLRQAQKLEAIGTLAGGIAHDFNNILSPIMIHSEMTMMALTPDSPLQHNIKQIYKAGERATELVKQILTFARKREQESAPIQVSLITKEVIGFLTSTIPSTIHIQYWLKAEQDTVLADPTQINQIVMNLCTNAAHAMREKGGVLEVNLSNEYIGPDETNQFVDLSAGHYLRLSVSDTGSGISQDIIDKIFEPYFTTKGPGEGTGMGLAMVHGIVKSYGGDIAVESSPGEGTVFHVMLPVVETESTPTFVEKVEIPRGNEKILLVDDEKVAVDTIQSMLETLGYNVTARTSSIEALVAFRNNPNSYDLVITDQTMPKMTGKELAQELMTIRPDVSIILCTGFSEQIDEIKAKAMGISFVMKPIVLSEIAYKIRELLDKE